jgi:murein L,D-transpeptidase YcbB/YkuD
VGVVQAFIVLVLVAGRPLLAVGAVVDGDDATRDAVRALVERGSLSQLKRPDFSAYRPALEHFFAQHEYAGRWLAPDAPWRQALDELAAAPTHGLDPADYDVAWLRAEFDAIAKGDEAKERRPRAEVALTVSLFRLLSDLHIGRVEPERAGFAFIPKHTRLDLPALTQSAIDGRNVHAAIVSAEPTFPPYTRLKEALARARTLGTEPLSPVPALPKNVRKIAPGDIYEGVGPIAERLRRMGDLPTTAPIPTDNRYDGPLVEAVRSYQDRHGLKPDGILGAGTLAELSVPWSTRVRQFELSMERLRWLPEFGPGALIAVNIPSFRLWAFENGRDDNAATLSMRVIVGAAVHARETPVFIGEMRYLEFSPYWNVTPSIQRTETVPMLRRDPGYWQREELEAIPARGGAPITVLDATTLDGLASGTLRVRQRPGRKNALGGVKFVLPNTMNIYLHGTPAQQLFSETRRAFSHGCIRLEDPPALAAFVLSDRPEWTRERIDAAMSADKMSTAKLTRPIPVVLFYTTAIVDAKYRALFSDDIYGYDAKLEAALKAR